MKKVDLFIFRSFIGPMAMTFFIVLVIFILQFLWMYVDDLAGKGLPLNVLAELLFQFSLTFVPLSLPLAILLASLMTFGNLGEYMELTALKASGIPLRRLMMPLFIFVGMISIASFFFADYILPISNQKARTLLWDIKRKRPELNIQAGTFYNGIDGFSIKITHKDPVTNRLDRLFIYDHRPGVDSKNAVIVADSGYMKVTPDETAIILTLYHGNSYTDINEKGTQADKKKYPFRRDSFEEQVLVIELQDFNLERSGENMYKSNQAMQNSKQLSNSIDSLQGRYGRRSVNYYREFSRSKVYANISMQPSKSVRQKRDTTITILPLNPREIYDTISLMDKRTSVNKALSVAREAASTVKEKHDALIVDKKTIKKYETEFYKKFSLAFACIVFFLIGAPLGAIIRKGGLGTPAVISVLFFVVYYVISITGEKFARELFVSAPLGMFASTIVLFPIGLFLTYKATTDSSLMDTETYTKIFKRLVSQVKSRAGRKKNEDTRSDN